MLQIYNLTKGVFQCGTWNDLSQVVYKRFHTCIMGLYRDITCTYHGNPQEDDVLSDSDLLFKYELMHPWTILKYSRLMLFMRIVKKAPKQLSDLIKDSCGLKGCWSTAVVGDFMWLSVSDDVTLSSNITYREMHDFVASDFRKFKRLVKKFAWTRIANISCEKVPVAKIAFSGAGHACNICNTTFMTFQQLALHSFKKHGVKNMMSLYVGDCTHCTVCLKQFWTLERLLNHVRYRSKICKYNLKIRGPVCDSEQASLFSKECAESNTCLHRQGKRRHYKEDPVIQLVGPLLPVMLPPGSKESKHHPLGLGHNYR